jgi:hypothetical protein
MEKTIELRQLTLDLIDVPLLQRPVVFKGSDVQCSIYAAHKGYKWKNDRNLLFKGYFVDTNGNCLMPT